MSWGRTAVAHEIMKHREPKKEAKRAEGSRVS